MLSKSRWTAPLVLFALVVLFYWKLVLTNQYTWLENPDLANLVLPWLQFQAGEWHMGHFPLWDPNSWFGQSLFGQAQPGAAYPLNWLLFLAPLKHGWISQAALHWYFVLTRYLAALTMYALARALGRSKTASVLAGCIYALGGYVAGTLAPQMVNGAVWTPLVFLYLFRAERGERPWSSALLSGFFLGVGWLAGHHQMNLYVSLAAAGLWIWLCLHGGKLDKKMLRLAAASMLIAVCASAFQTIPEAEYGRSAVRFTPDPQHFNETVPYTVLEQYSLKPVELLGIFLPNVDGKFVPFVGVAALSFALLGAILAWDDRRVRWLAMIGLGGVLFALGPNSLLHGVFYSLVPLVEKARVPQAGLLLFALAAAPLAAFGVDLLGREESFRWSRRAIWALMALAVVLTVAGFVFFIINLAPADDKIAITAICALAAAGLLAAFRGGIISHRAGTIAAVALVLFELADVTTAYLPNRSVAAQNPYLHKLAEQSDLAAYVRQRGEPARIEYDDNVIPYNIGDWFGLEAMNAYTASVASNIWDMDLFSARAKDFFGIRFVFAKTAPRPGLIDVFTGRSGMKVFENPTAYPRAWTVHEVRSLADVKLIPAAMAAPDFSAQKTALLAREAAPELSACSDRPENTQMPLHEANRVRMNVNLPCRGMVILSDSWFPGWRATVDGKSARIYEVYGGVRGVVVEAGEHVIEMRYRPVSVMLGAMLSLLAGLVVVVVRRREA